MKKIKNYVLGLGLIAAVMMGMTFPANADCVSCDGMLDTARCEGIMTKTCSGDTGIFLPATCRGGLAECPNPEIQ